MGELEILADGKIVSAMANRAEALAGEISALHRRLIADRGFGGHLTLESEALCLRRLADYAAEITSEMSWVVAEALWIDDALVDRLVQRADEHLAAFMPTCVSCMEASTDLTGDRARLMPQIRVSLDARRAQAWNQIGLALRAKKAERVRFNVRNAVPAIGRAISWLARAAGLSGK